MQEDTQLRHTVCNTWVHTLLSVREYLLLHYHILEHGTGVRESLEGPEGSTIPSVALFSIYTAICFARSSISVAELLTNANTRDVCMVTGAGTFVCGEMQSTWLRNR